MKLLALWVAGIDGVIIGVCSSHGISMFSWEGVVTFVLGYVAVKLVGAFDE